MRPVLALLGLAALIVGPPFLGDFQVYLLSLALLWAILALGMGLLLGYLGELNFGQAAFVAIAAYTATLLRTHADLTFWLASAIALIVVAVMAILVGLVSFRVRGPFFALVTLGFGEIVRLIIANWQDLTNGPLGLRAIAPPEAVFGVAFGSKLAFFYLILAVLLFCIGAMVLILRSKTGAMFAAIREDPTLAEFIGIPLMRYKVIALTISAIMGGLAGVLLGPFLTVLSPAQFTIFASVDMIIMVVVGGAGTIIGPLIGAVFLIYVPELLSFAAEYRPLIFGVLLIALMIFMPSGVMGVLTKGVRWAFPRLARGSAVSLGNRRSG